MINNRSRAGTGKQSGAVRLLAGFDDLFQCLDSPPGLYVKETEKKDSTDWKAK